MNCSISWDLVLKIENSYFPGGRESVRNLSAVWFLDAFYSEHLILNELGQRVN